MAHTTDLPPTLTAANNNRPGLQTIPAPAILTFAGLLGEVCVAHLAAANTNRAPRTTSGEGVL